MSHLQNYVHNLGPILKNMVPQVPIRQRAIYDNVWEEITVPDTNQKRKYQQGISVLRGVKTLALMILKVRKSNWLPLGHASQVGDHNNHNASGQPQFGGRAIYRGDSFYMFPATYTSIITTL